MIIVLKPRTTKDDVSRVENMVKKRGLNTHVVQGEEMTVIGCIGDTAKVDSKLFEIDSAVDKVMHVQEPYKLANRAFHPEQIFSAAAHSSQEQVLIHSRDSDWKDSTS